MSNYAKEKKKWLDQNNNDHTKIQKRQITSSTRMVIQQIPFHTLLQLHLSFPFKVGVGNPMLVNGGTKAEKIQ